MIDQSPLGYTGLKKLYYENEFLVFESVAIRKFEMTFMAHIVFLLGSAGGEGHRKWLFLLLRCRLRTFPVLTEIMCMSSTV